MKKLFNKLASNHILELLSYPPYLYFTLSVFFSQVAFNMLNVVLIFLVFFLTSSNFAVAILLFAVLVPQIVLSFFGGMVADAADKKKIIVLGNILRAIVLIVLFLNFQSAALVYLVTLVISSITQFYVPAEAPLIPVLVKREHLVAANSIFGISLFGSILIGYVAAGPAVRILGRADTFLLISFLFLLATFFAILIPKDKVAAASANKSMDVNSFIRRSMRTELKESLYLLKKTAGVGDAFFLLIFSQIIIFILATLIPGYAKNILQIPAEDLSTMIFAPAAVGMVLAALAIGGIFSRAGKRKLMSTGVFMSGIILFLLPFTSRIFAQGIIQTINQFLPQALNLNVFNFVLILAFFAGFANALIFIPSQAIIQEAIPSDFRSKIYGLLFALIGLFSLIPIMAAGGVADVLGVGAVFVFLGIGVIMIGFLREGIWGSFYRRFTK